jgi:ATP-dependent RNA helicase DDX19/DBP5
MDICKHFNVEPTKLDTSDWDEVEKMLKAVMKNSRNNTSNNQMKGAAKDDSMN